MHTMGVTGKLQTEDAQFFVTEQREQDMQPEV